MSVTKKDVEHIAALAHLEFSDDEKETLTQHMNQILDYMQQLSKLNTENVEPLSHVIELHNVFRDDVVKPSLGTEKTLANAPQTDGQFFLVPKILDEGAGAAFRCVGSPD